MTEEKKLKQEKVLSKIKAFKDKKRKIFIEKINSYLREAHSIIKSSNKE